MSGSGSGWTGRTDGEAPAVTGRPGVAERVLRHFQQNAEAMDSAEGIARFWVHEDRGVVERCLLDLCARGLLEKRTIAGTDFYSAPKGRERAQAASPAARPAETEPQAAPRSRILVVDDDPEVAALLVEVLSRAGHSVEGAEEGQRALELFQAHPFDIVVTDLALPGVPGLDLLRSVKQASPATEVIVVTGHASVDNAIQALRHGAYDLITKPLDDIESLVRVVERALERRLLSAENRSLLESLKARNLELKRTVARLAAVNEISQTATGLFDLSELYDSLVRLVAQHLEARRVSVLISEPDSDTMVLVASVGITEQDVRDRRVRLGEGIAGRVAASQSPLLVQDIDKTDLKSLSTGGRYSTPSFLITPLRVSYPIRYQRKRVGVINVSDKLSGDPFTEQDLEFLSTLSCQVAAAIENAQLVREMENGYLGALVALIQAAEEARPQTRGHSRRVSDLATAMARAMGLSQSRVELLVKAAALHEVGRLSGGVEQEGGAAGEKAAGREWTSDAAMAAGRILAPIHSLREVREILFHSADRFDAGGVPFGADRPSIPVESRILAVCEDFVSLTPGDGADPEGVRRALEALRKQARRKHDPELVAILCRLAELGGVR